MTVENKPFTSKSVFIISGGLLAAFVLAAVINLEAMQPVVNKAFALSCTYFGAIWQFMLLAHFLIALALMASSLGSVRLGGLDAKPEISFFKWVAMIMCALLAGGGVFWSAAEPITHFLNVPPSIVGYANGTMQAVGPGMAQAFLHWGFLAWAVLGTLGVIVLMYACHHKGMPFQPRSLLYPLMGEKGVKGPWGTLVDASSIVAVAAGTIGPIGFLSLQLSYSIQQLTGIPDSFSTQLAVVIFMTLIYTFIALTPIYKGINIASQINVYAALFLMAFIMIFGPGGFVVDSFFSGLGIYIKEFFNISLYRGDSGWLSWWTVFFWGWFLGYGPMMVIFVARVSYGRTIRELVLAVALIAPIATNIWFSVLGGATIFFELNNPGSIAGPMTEVGFQTALFSTMSQLPLKSIMIPYTLALLVVFLVVCGASMTYSIAISVTDKVNPPKWVILFWGLVMGAITAILIKMGSGGINALQTSIVIAAVPVTIYFFPLLWTGPRCAMIMKREQDEAARDRAPVCAPVEIEAPLTAGTPLPSATPAAR